MNKDLRVSPVFCQLVKWPEGDLGSVLFFPCGQLSARSLRDKGITEEGYLCLFIKIFARAAHPCFFGRMWMSWGDMTWTFGVFFLTARGDTSVWMWNFRKRESTRTVLVIWSGGRTDERARARVCVCVWHLLLLLRWHKRYRCLCFAHRVHLPTYVTPKKRWAIVTLSLEKVHTRTREILKISWVFLCTIFRRRSFGSTHLKVFWIIVGHGFIL